MSLPEKIDNGKMGLKRGQFEAWQKKQAHRHNRKLTKKYLKAHEQPPNHYGKYKGWTT